MKKIIIQILNLILPTIIFYLIYQVVGIANATVISSVYSLVQILLKYKKDKTISNTQVLGFIGLILSSVAITFTDNEKLYYIPALINNFIIALFMLVLALKKKSILHYITKDFNIRWLDHIDEVNILKLNYVWMIFFLLKIVSKIVGILFLDFDILYWVIFLLGDPAMVVVIGISIYFIKKQNTPLTKNDLL